MQQSVIESTAEGNGDKKVRSYGKRVSISALLESGIVQTGDQWKLSSKGETTWGRIEANGQLEVNGTGHGNPSKAYMAVLGKPGNGWYYWLYRDENGEFRRVDALRQQYRDQASHKPRLTVVSSG